MVAMKKKKGRPPLTVKLTETVHARMFPHQLEKLKKIGQELGPNAPLSPASIIRYWINNYQLKNQ